MARSRHRFYDEAVRQALVALWEAGDRVCGKRLEALLPALIGAMERHGHLDLDVEVRARLLQVSASTVDRILLPTRLQIDGTRRRRTGSEQRSGAASRYARSPTGEIDRDLF